MVSNGEYSIIMLGGVAAGSTYDVSGLSQWYHSSHDE
jgi:hypothetical protein